MWSIILFLLLGFLFPGHSLPLSPQNHISEHNKEPIVHIYPPVEVTHSPGNSLILSCFIRHIYRGDIGVLWERNGNPISEDNYVNTPSVKEKEENSSFMYSKLTSPKSEWENEDTYSCMVVHQALREKSVQRSIEKSPGKR